MTHPPTPAAAVKPCGRKDCLEVARLNADYCPLHERPVPTTGPARRPTPRTLPRLAALALAIGGLALFAAPALGEAAAPLHAKVKQRFTTTESGAWTGWSFDGALRPFAPGSQPQPQRGAAFIFPRGTRLDLTGAPRCGSSGGCGPAPSCTATDDQIKRHGLRACPAGSRVGSGEASLFSRTVGTVDVNVDQYIARPGLALVFTTAGGSVLGVLRATIHRNRVTATIPQLVLPGGYEAALTHLSLETPRGGTRKHPSLRTPPTCPKSRRWSFTYLSRYDEPHGVQRSTSSVPCTPHRPTATP
jgi:hypothetical protein